MTKDELKKYILDNFILDNGKVRYGLRENYLLKNHELVYNIIKERTVYLDENTNFPERIYHIINDLSEKPRCNHPDCNNYLKFYTFKNPYKQACSNVCGVYFNKNIKLERYGDANYNNAEKMLKTKEENDSYTLMKENHKKTCLERFGVEHHWQLPEIREKMIDTFMENYGCDHPMKNSDVLELVKKTNIERYGYENTFQVPEFKEKIHNSNVENYGVGMPLLNPEINAKGKATMVKIFGVEYYSQTGLGHSGYKWKEYTLPSGKIIKIQGYEGRYIPILIRAFGEENIIFERKEMPEIWYKGLDEKEHRYFPDFYIPKYNLIIEVKSMFTYLVEENKNKLKFEAVKELGYNFKLKVYNN